VLKRPVATHTKGIQAIGCPGDGTECRLKELPSKGLWSIPTHKTDSFQRHCLVLADLPAAQQWDENTKMSEKRHGRRFLVHKLFDNSH
jgi:hypothetical protein